MAIAFDTKNINELFQNYLEHSQSRVRYKNDAKVCSLDPWEYTAYREHVTNCLKAINEIFQAVMSKSKNFTIQTLVNAHFIKDLSLGIIQDKRITHRKATIEAGEALNSLFESFSLQLEVFARTLKFSKTLNNETLTKNLSEFSLKWEDFTTKFEQDQASVKKLLSKESHSQT